MKTFLSSTASGLALGPPQSPIQRAPGALSPGSSVRGVKLTTHIHLMPRLRMRKA